MKRTDLVFKFISANFLALSQLFLFRCSCTREKNLEFLRAYDTFEMSFSELVLP